MNTKEKETYDELAKKLAASYISYFLTNKSVDYTMRNYCKGTPSDFWFDLAKFIAKKVTIPVINIHND